MQLLVEVGADVNAAKDRGNSGTAAKHAGTVHAWWPCCSIEPVVAYALLACTGAKRSCKQQQLQPACRQPAVRGTCRVLLKCGSAGVHVLATDGMFLPCSCLR